MPTTVSTPNDLKKLELQLVALKDYAEKNVESLRSRCVTLENALASVIKRLEKLETSPAPTPIPVPPVPVIPPPVPPPPGDTVLFELSHLKQTGVWLMPYDVKEGRTGYAPGLLAMRVINGEKIFISDEHIYSGGDLYAFRLKPDGSTEFMQNFGQSLYGGKRKEGKNVNGLFVNHSEPDALYWCGDQGYDTADKGDTIAFRTRFKPGTWEVIGVDEMPNPAGSNNLQTRGGFARLPSGEVIRGHGGYYSIIAGGSYGPCLVGQDGKVYLRYSIDNRCPRPNDYHMSAELDPDGDGDGGWMGRNGGTWTCADLLGGETLSSACVILDGVVPGFRGTLFTTQQGTGRIGYDSGSITNSGGLKSRLYWYDTADLLAVSRGENAEWEPAVRFADLPRPSYPMPPGEYQNVPIVSGGCLDYTTGKLYLVWVSAVPVGREWAPILVEYSFQK